jgi:TonB family protein
MHARLLVLVVLLLAGVAPVSGQESVQVAQTLYASASYDEALVVLDRLEKATLSLSELKVINQQRALCLLALGRGAEAEMAIAAVVTADPLFRLDASSVSPRVRSAFRDVRTRLLPELVQKEYVEARRLYDEQAWPEAAVAFERVLTLSTDADLTAEQQAALADRRLLADGFAKLAHAAAAPPPPPPAPRPEAEVPVSPAIDYDLVFAGATPGIVAPVTLRQDLPQWNHSSLPLPRHSGSLEIVISAQGVVERATMVQSVAAFYDRVVLDAVKHWRYEPASLDGRPVRFRKMIRISFR